MNLDYTTREVNGVCIFTIKGRLDTVTSKPFEEILSKHLTDGVKHICIDFSNTTYISSAGLRVLLSVAKKLSAVEGNIALSNMSQEIKKIFDLAGFSKILKIYSSTQEAIDKC